MKAAQDFKRHQLRTLGRLKRVNQALARWDEYESAQSLPEDIRPEVTPPSLSRDALQSLRATLVSILGELDEMWERRN